MIYFISNKTNNVVKIGYTRCDVDKRLYNLQCANSEPLTLITTIDGDIILEKELHERFKAYRKIGEWFTLSNELSDYINQFVEKEQPKPDLQSRWGERL